MATIAFTATRVARNTKYFGATSGHPSAAAPASVHATARTSRLRKNRVKTTKSCAPRWCGEPGMPAGSARLAATLAGPQGSAPGPRSSRRLGEVAEADQVVDRQAEDEHPVHASPAAMARLAQQPDGLEPAEDLFDALAFPLADSVPGVAGGALIDRTRTIRGVLRHVRRHLDEPEGLDEVPRVIAFVGPDGDPVRGRHVAEHLQRRGALPVPARPGDAALDRQAVAIVHEHVPLIGELGLVALRFADQPRVGVGGRPMGDVAPPLAVEVDRGITRIVRRLDRGVRPLEAL